MIRSLVVRCAISLLLFVPAFAGELQVKVLDPHSAAVAGAQVSLFRVGESAPLQVRTTSGEGLAIFSVDTSAPLSVEVLAPGFAAAQTNIEESSSTAIVALQVAGASETVVVTATRTPAPEQQTASSVSLLTGEQITTMLPVAFSDAIRFLPGAVVNVSGQRGGLGSLFVRGGDSRYNKVVIDEVPVNEPGGTFDFGTVPLVEADRVEFQRGSLGTLYGSDAMTSVVQVFSRSGIRNCASALTAAILELLTDSLPWPAPAHGSITTPSQINSKPTGKDRTPNTGMLSRAEMLECRLIRQSFFVCVPDMPIDARECRESGVSTATESFRPTKTNVPALTIFWPAANC